MKHADVKTALECIKLFAFEDLIDVSANKGRRCPVMCHDVRFVVGATGGVVVVRVADNRGYCHFLCHLNVLQMQTNVVRVLRFFTPFAFKIQLSLSLAF